MTSSTTSAALGRRSQSESPSSEEREARLERLERRRRREGLPWSPQPSASEDVAEVAEARREEEPPDDEWRRAEWLLRFLLLARLPRLPRRLAPSPSDACVTRRSRITGEEAPLPQPPKL